MSASAILKLQKVGFTPEQVEALADFMDDRAATKADLLEVEHRLDLKIGEVKADISEVKAGIAAVRAEAKADNAALRAEAKADNERVEAALKEVRTELKADIRELGLQMTIRLGTMLIALAGILIAAIRYLPQHP